MAILFVNRSDSRCGECRQPADPYEASHETKTGYNPGKGCGALFDALSSDYMGIDREVKRLRPDLKFIDPMEALGDRH